MQLDDAIGEAPYGNAFDYLYCGRCAALVRL